MDYEQFIKSIMQCEEYRKALNDPSHPCYNIVHKYDPPLLCEPFRHSAPIDDVEVIFLGLSPGNREKSFPRSPEKNAPLEDVKRYCRKPIREGYYTNFRNTMKERIGTELEYVKANVVHGIGDKKYALECLETCGDKFLEDMIELFRGHTAKYVIVYDFDDKPVLDYINRKLHINLGFENSTAKNGIPWDGITFIAARRAPHRYIRRLRKP